MIRRGNHPGRRPSRVRKLSTSRLPGLAAAGGLCWLLVFLLLRRRRPGVAPSALPASQTPPPDGNADSRGNAAPDSNADSEVDGGSGGECSKMAARRRSR